MPEMMCFCTMKAKIATGITVTVPTAAIDPYEVPMGVMRVGMATGSVWVLRPVRTSAKRNSFHELMTQKIAVAASPPLASGIHLEEGSCF